MRKNVEEYTVTKERITWIASDGKVFETEEECKKYEATAEFAIISAFNDIPKKTCEGQDFLNNAAYMACDSDMYAITISNADVLEIVNKYLKLYTDCNHESPYQIPVKYVGKRIILELYEGYVCNYKTPEEYKKQLCQAVDHFFGEESQEENA